HWRPLAARVHVAAPIPRRAGPPPPPPPHHQPQAPPPPAAPTPTVTTSAKAEAPMTASTKSVDMSALPAVDLSKAANAGHKVRFVPSALTGRSASQWAQLKKANRIKNAPRPSASETGGFTVPAAGASSSAVQTPVATTGFKGLDDQCNIAFTGGFSIAPSDLAVASSAGLITEVINACIAVYSSTGVLQAGFPKSLQAF